MKRFFHHAWREERGNAESALVLIPLLILFFIGYEIAAVTHQRNFSRVIAQDQASKRAISGEFNSSDRFLHIESSGDGQNLDLLINRTQREIPWLVPDLLGAKRVERVEVNGIAIVENQR